MCFPGFVLKIVEHFPYEPFVYLKLKSLRYKTHLNETAATIGIKTLKKLVTVTACIGQSRRTLRRQAASLG